MCFFVSLLKRLSFGFQLYLLQLRLYLRFLLIKHKICLNQRLILIVFHLLLYLSLRRALRMNANFLCFVEYLMDVGFSNLQVFSSLLSDLFPFGLWSVWSWFSLLSNYSFAGLSKVIFNLLFKIFLDWLRLSLRFLNSWIHLRRCFLSLLSVVVWFWEETVQLFKVFGHYYRLKHMDSGWLVAHFVIHADVLVKL